MKNSVWKTFMELSLVRGIVPRTVFGLTAIAAIILVIGLALSKSKKRGRLHPLIVSLIAAVLAGAAGLLVVDGWCPTCLWCSAYRWAGR